MTVGFGVRFGVDVGLGVKIAVGLIAGGVWIKGIDPGVDARARAVDVNEELGYPEARASIVPEELQLFIILGSLAFSLPDNAGLQEAVNVFCRIPGLKAKQVHNDITSNKNRNICFILLA